MSNSKWQGNIIKFGRMNTAETKINFRSIIHVEASHAERQAPAD